MQTPAVVRIVQSIAEIDPAEWDRCANPALPATGLAVSDAGVVIESRDVGERFNPFISHAFLSALESSRSVGGRTGWVPTHVVVETKEIGRAHV